MVDGRWDSSVLVVAGFHRSGTSLVTEILARAGLFVGDDLIGANPSNPYGHFEDRDVVRLHDGVLADSGLTWHVDRPFVPSIRPERWAHMARLVDHRQARHRRWGFKDPRICFFLAPWKYLAPEMKVLAVYRDPRECSWSLERRHLREIHSASGPVDLHRLFWRRPDHALRMWVAYNRALLEFVYGHRDDTLVLPHAAIVDGLPIVSAVNEVLGAELEPVDNREVFDPTVTRGRPGRPWVSSPRVVEDVLATWGELEALAAEDADRYDRTAHAV